MVDMAQADRTLRFIQSSDEGVFDRFRERLSAYLADCINEEKQNMQEKTVKQFETYTKD